MGLGATGLDWEGLGWDWFGLGRKWGGLVCTGLYWEGMEGTWGDWEVKGGDWFVLVWTGMDWEENGGGTGSDWFILGWEWGGRGDDWEGMEGIGGVGGVSGVPPGLSWFILGTSPPPPLPFQARQLLEKEFSALLSAGTERRLDEVGPPPKLQRPPPQITPPPHSNAPPQVLYFPSLFWGGVPKFPP